MVGPRERGERCPGRALPPGRRGGARGGAVLRDGGALAARRARRRGRSPGSPRPARRRAGVASRGRRPGGVPLRVPSPPAPRLGRGARPPGGRRTGSLPGGRCAVAGVARAAPRLARAVRRRPRVHPGRVPGPGPGRGRGVRAVRGARARGRAALRRVAAEIDDRVGGDERQERRHDLLAVHRGVGFLHVMAELGAELRNRIEQREHLRADVRSGGCLARERDPQPAGVAGKLVQERTGRRWRHVGIAGART